MSPDRIRELRRAGVLEGERLDAARIAVLDLYERARGWTRRRAPEEQAFRIEVTFALDPVMRDTELATGIRLAKRAARRSP